MITITKRLDYYDNVFPLLENNDFDNLERYILTHSNLPGKMANLTLISLIADIMDANPSIAESWFPTLRTWFDAKADGNNAETILLLTALESFGAIYHHSTKEQHFEITAQLKNSLNNERWRVREIVTESYKRIGLSSYEELITQFEVILSEKITPLEMRGLLATVAHPELLHSEQQLIFSQKIMTLAFNFYMDLDLTKFTKEDKLVLKKGLSFAPSVIVSKNPKEGFLFFDTLVTTQDKDITRIVKENLKKKRLSNVYPDEVESLLGKIEKNN